MTKSSCNTPPGEPSMPDLTDADLDTLAKLLRDTIAADRFPLSPGVRRWKAILDKLEPLKPPGTPNSRAASARNAITAPRCARRCRRHSASVVRLHFGCHFCAAPIEEPTGLERHERRWLESRNRGLGDRPAADGACGERHLIGPGAWIIRGR
jgi:hypothetical protein